MILFCKKCRTRAAWGGHAEPGSMPLCAKCYEPTEDWDARQRRHLVDAYNVQDASNISGVVLSMARLMEELSEGAAAVPDRQLYIRTHPALIMWMDKVHDMMGRPAWGIDSNGEVGAIDRAFELCYEAAHAGRP